MDWILCLGLLIQTLICSVISQDSSQMPPNMTSTFNDEYFFPRDSILADAAFNCTAENGRVQYVWKKDGVVVQNTQFVTVNNSMGILKFVRMQNEDYGTYQCFATNDYGTSLSKPFKIMEARLGYFPTSQIQEVQCEEFKHCKVECRDKPTCLPESQCKVEWKIGEGTKTNVEINERVGVDGNGDLHFLWTNMSDWTGQQYRCGVWHEQLKTLVVGRQTSLRIDSATAVTKVDPILVFKENGKALIGEKGVLRCMISGYPVPDIMWISPQKMYINNTEGKYEISDFGRVLTILQAKSEYEGTYTCKHSGENESVFLNVTSAPFLRGNNQMQDLMVPEGKEATFRCEAESSPNEIPPTLPAWKKNGVDLKTYEGKYLLREKSKVLSVTNVQKSDTGVYQCMSENSEGVLMKEAILKVLDPITIRERPLGSYKIVPGDALNLAMVADTDPSLTLQYKWMFTDHQGNKREIESNEYWKISGPNKNNLTIDVGQVKEPSILLSLAGIYSIKMYHKYDQEVIKITVETDIITMETSIPSDIFTTDISTNIITTKDSSQMPPNLTSTFNDEYFFPRDSTLPDASFNCTAENGRVQYVWKKDGVVVQNTQVDNSMGILKFVKMQNEDYGTYQCFASNDNGTSLSKPFKIMEARLGSFPTTQSEEVGCKEFEHCKVQCRDKPPCLPESQCKVEWKIGEGTKTNVEINKRVGVDGNGDLHFLWINSSDWNGEHYRCGVWHEQLKTLVVGSQTSLKIYSGTAVSKVDPIFVFKENGKALIGEKGVLRCIFSGYPVPDIMWISPQEMYINNTDGNYEISDFGRVLTILQAESENEGKYTCEQSGKNESVFLNVTSAPFLSGNNQMQDLMVPEGKEATFRCEAESSPNEIPPTPPAWKKNGVDLKTYEGKYLLRENSKVLTLTNVQKSDTGVYQCMSENSEGVLLKEAILKVLDPITIRERPLGSYKIVPGDVLNLAVVADTDPSLTLQYKWMFTDHQGNEKEIESNEYWKISGPNKNNLTIDVRQVKEQSSLLSVVGYYSVKMYHNYDQEVIKITVETDVITMETGITSTDIFTTDIVNTDISTNIITTKVIPKPQDSEETSSNAAVSIVVAVIVSLIVIVIVIIVARRIQQKGYSMDKKELATGHDSENERKENSLKDQPV